MKIKLSLSGLLCPSEDLHRAFKKLADEQRDKPEQMFKAKINPGCEHSGAWQWAMEHTGDLVHRASQADLPEWGLEAVQEKTIKLLRACKAVLPLGKDIDRQLRSNYEYHSDPERGKHQFKGSLEKWEQMAYDAGRKYARAYMELKPITHLQRLGIDAAIACGQAHWSEMRDILTEIKYLIDNGKAEQQYFEVEQ